MFHEGIYNLNLLSFWRKVEDENFIIMVASSNRWCLTTRSRRCINKSDERCFQDLAPKVPSSWRSPPWKDNPKELRIERARYNVQTEPQLQQQVNNPADKRRNNVQLDDCADSNDVPAVFEADRQRRSTKSFLKKSTPVIRWLTTTQVFPQTAFSFVFSF